MKTEHMTKISTRYLSMSLFRLMVVLLLLVWIGVGNSIEHEGEIEDSIENGLLITFFMIFLIDFICIMVIGADIESYEKTIVKTIEQNEKES